MRDSEKPGATPRLFSSNDNSTAATVFDDEFALTIPDDHPAEIRYVTIGMDALARVLVVVWTPRGENIRIIPARKATRYEQEQYNEGR